MTRKSQSTYDKERGMIMGALAKGEDLMEGILAACKKHGVSAGKVCCIGSLQKAVFVQPALQNGKPAYSKPVEWNHLVEVLSATGFLSQTEEGELDLHMHAIVVNEEGMISGGHFLKGENCVAVTIEFSVHVMQADVRRAYDESEGFRLLTFQPQKGE